MIEWDWRVESPRGIAFGSSSLDCKRRNGIASLLGKRVEAVSLFGMPAELCVEFDDGRRLRSFSCVEGSPTWVVFLRDLRRFPCDPKWAGVDHSLWFTFQGGRFVEEVGFANPSSAKSEV